MPQGPIAVQNVPAVPGPQKTKLNITTQTVLKAAPGDVVRVVVQAAGSATGTINDCATTAAVSTANQVAVIPETVGPIDLEFPCLVGIVVTPGTGQSVAVSYL